jgi:hypothetical protein
MTLAQAWNNRGKRGVLMQGFGGIMMRLLLGIILGVCLTVGGAYIYDSHNALDATGTTGAPGSASASALRPMVNWDIVSVEWQHLTERARSEWTRLTG